MDILSDIFETVQLRGMLYFRTDFTPPWGTTIPELGRATRFHYVLSGECWLRVGDRVPRRLVAGDLVLVPGGAAHILASAPDLPAPPLEEVLRAANYAGEGNVVLRGEQPEATTRLVCGHFTFARGADHPLLRALPDHMVISAQAREQRPWLDAVLNLLVTKVFRHPDAPVAVMTRLSEILLIEALRSAGDEAPAVRQLVRGFGDPRIGQAVALIHRQPERDWTLDDLARAVGMSRTRFATRFRELIGMAPIGYLAEWRLQRAATLLGTTSRPVADIGYACGYVSATAFARAFGDRFGTTPSQWRRQPGRD